MSADKRKVSTDALETLGTIIGENEKRDAIHLAVLPVVAGMRLYPGQEINANSDGVAAAATGGLGIVDPFLPGVVHPEQRFWMVLKPRIITSLRHVWSHPSFADEAGTNPSQATADKAAARAELERIAASCDLSVDEMIEAAHDRIDNGNYLCDGGRWEGMTTSGRSSSSTRAARCRPTTATTSSRVAAERERDGSNAHLSRPPVLGDDPRPGR
jgi:hypothetical protein